MPYADALKIAKEISNVEDSALREAKQKLAIMQRRLLRFERFNVREYLIKSLAPILVESLAISYGLGEAIQREQFEQRKKRKPKDRTLSLSLKSISKKLKKRSGISLKDLREKYEREAEEILEVIAETSEERINTLFDRLTIEESKTVKQQEIQQELRKLGVLPNQNNKVEAVFRTRNSIAFNAGRWQADQAPEIQEILWGYEYVAILDDRVREEHAALDGTKLPKEHAFWGTFWPPNGWNCRCTVISIFEKERISNPPSDVFPDTGFEFNPGVTSSVSLSLFAKQSLNKMYRAGALSV